MGKNAAEPKRMDNMPSAFFVSARMTEGMEKGPFGPLPKVSPAPCLCPAGRASARVPSHDQCKPGTPRLGPAPGCGGRTPPPFPQAPPRSTPRGLPNGMRCFLLPFPPAEPDNGFLSVRSLFRLYLLSPPRSPE